MSARAGGDGFNREGDKGYYQSHEPGYGHRNSSNQGQRQYRSNPGQDQHRSGQGQYRSNPGQDQYRSGQDQYRSGQDQHRSGQGQYRSGQGQHRSGQDQYRPGQDRSNQNRNYGDRHLFGNNSGVGPSSNSYNPRNGYGSTSGLQRGFSQCKDNSDNYSFVSQTPSQPGINLPTPDSAALPTHDTPLVSGFDDLSYQSDQKQMSDDNKIAELNVFDSINVKKDLTDDLDAELKTTDGEQKKDSVDHEKIETTEKPEEVEKPEQSKETESAIEKEQIIESAAESLSGKSFVDTNESIFGDQSCDEFREKLVGAFDQGFDGSFTFKVGPKEVKVSKMFFAVQSNVFVDLMFSDSDEAKRCEFNCDKLDFKAVKQFVDFIHFGNVKHLDRYVEDILELAEKFDIDVLKTICIQHLESRQLTDDNIMKSLISAFEKHDDEKKKEALDYLAQTPENKKFVSIMLSDDWYEFQLGNPHLAREIMIAVLTQ